MLIEGTTVLFTQCAESKEKKQNTRKTKKKENEYLLLTNQAHVKTNWVIKEEEVIRAFPSIVGVDGALTCKIT